MRSTFSKLLFFALATVGAVGTARRETPVENMGSIAYFEGQVVLDGRTLLPEAAVDMTVRNGSKLSTETGHAEILLIPGMIVTVGDHSQIRFSEFGDQRFQVALQQGSMMAVLTGPIAGGALTVTDQGGSVLLDTAGWYRVTADDPPRAAALKGRAEASYGTRRVEMHKGREVMLTAALPQRSFRQSPEDELYRWTEACLPYGFGMNLATGADFASTRAEQTGTSAARAEGNIRLSVIALDRSGAPVDNLRSSDFHIMDAGKTQPITGFRRTPHRMPRPTLILLDLLNERMADRRRDHPDG
jgi:hypothetical protein